MTAPALRPPTSSLSLPSDLSGWDLRLEQRLVAVRARLHALDESRLDAATTLATLGQLWAGWSGSEQRAALQHVVSQWRPERWGFRQEAEPSNKVSQGALLHFLLERLRAESQETGVVWDPRWDVLQPCEWLDEWLDGFPGGADPTPEQAQAQALYRAQIADVGTWAASVGTGATVRAQLDPFRSRRAWMAGLREVQTMSPADVEDVLERFQFDGLALLAAHPALDTPEGMATLRDVFTARLHAWHQSADVRTAVTRLTRHPLYGRTLDEGRTWPGLATLLEGLVRHQVSMTPLWNALQRKSPFLHEARMTPLLNATADLGEALPPHIIQARPAASAEAWARTLQHPQWRPKVGQLWTHLSASTKQTNADWPVDQGFDPAAPALLEGSGVYHQTHYRPASWARVLASPDWTPGEIEGGLQALLAQWPRDMDLRREILKNRQTSAAWAAEVFLAESGEVALREVAATRPDLLSDGRVRQVLMQSSSLNVLEELTLHAPDTASFNVSLGKLIKRDLPTALRVLEHRDLDPAIKLRSSLLRPFLVHEERGVKTRAIQALGRWQQAGAVEAGALSVTEKRQAKGRQP